MFNKNEINTCQWFYSENNGFVGESINQNEKLCTTVILTNLSIGFYSLIFFFFWFYFLAFLLFSFKHFNCHQFNETLSAMHLQWLHYTKWSDSNLTSMKILGWENLYTTDYEGKIEEKKKNENHGI